jgi:hypothetical protein
VIVMPPDMRLSMALILAILAPIAGCERHDPPGESVGSVSHMDTADAKACSGPRDFYGECDDDLTATPNVPDGMKCGGQAVGSGLTVQTTEPPEGFTGACLLNRPYPTYGLPTVCFSPTSATYILEDATRFDRPQCTVPAANVLQPNWHIAVDQTNHTVTREAAKDSYRVLETCVPHTAAGSCPQNTLAISHSCCSAGAPMTSADGQTATGTVYFLAH